MNANRKKRPSRTQAEWIEEVRRWRKSGLTATEYGAKHDVHPGTLMVWGSKLREVVPLAGRRRQRGAGMFLPVRATSGERPPVSTAEAGVEVVLRNGRRVRVGGDFQAEVLARVLDVAEGGGRC